MRLRELVTFLLLSANVKAGIVSVCLSESSSFDDIPEVCGTDHLVTGQT
jgi:hypothetical protein